MSPTKGVPNSPKFLCHHSNPFEIKSFAFGFPHLDELNSLYCQDQHSLSIYLRARWFVPSSSSIYNLPRFNSTNYWAVYINAPLSNRGGQLSLNHPNADITLFVAVCCNISKFGKVSTTSFTCYYTIICMVVIVLSYLSYSWLFQARWFVPLSSSISNLFELDSTNCRAVYIDTPLLDQDGT